MPQTILPFKLECEKDMDLTSHAGLPLIHELFHKINLPKIIRRHLKVKEKGWTETDLIETLLSLFISGGEHMEDIAILKQDPAFLKLLKKKNGLPSVKAIERFLKKFHKDQKKPEGILAWVPEETQALKGLSEIRRIITRQLIELSGLKTVTIENDATIVFSHKEEAQGTYKGGIGYAPVLGTIAELGLIVHDEFRDGNVPASHDIAAFFKQCRRALPPTVTKIRTRLDGAYYEHDFLQGLKKEGIEFTVTADKSKSFIDWVETLPEESWKPLMAMTTDGPKPTGKEWAEMEWTSAEGTRETMRERTLRYLVTRKSQYQWEVFQEEFKSEVVRKDRYEAIATDMDWEGSRLIHWHYERGGGIEHIHDRVKNDLAGGVLPCAEFGANAAWWRLQCLAWNLVRALQIHALPRELSNCHLKKLRLWLFNIAGKVVVHARRIILKLREGHPAFEMYRAARLKIATLVWV